MMNLFQHQQFQELTRPWNEFRVTGRDFLRDHHIWWLVKSQKTGKTSWWTCFSIQQFQELTRPWNEFRVTGRDFLRDHHIWRLVKSQKTGKTSCWTCFSIQQFQELTRPWNKFRVTDRDFLRVHHIWRLVKSLKRLFSVIPAQAGIQPFQVVRISWIPVFTGMTTFYDSIIFKFNGWIGPGLAGSERGPPRDARSHPPIGPCNFYRESG